MTTKDLIDDYFELKEKIHQVFGYKEDWVTIPLEDSRKYYWTLDFVTYDSDQEVIGGDILFASTIDNLKDDTGEYHYSNEIYTQRFLMQYIYVTEYYTMICVDTHTDGNKFLQIFDNTKKIKL